MIESSNLPEKIRIVLADDHSLVRDGIRSLLAEYPEINVVAEAANGEEALQKVAENTPDILIVDIRMPKLNGIQTVFQLTQQASSTKALVLSMHDSEEYVLKSIEAGAYGYLLKDTSKEEFLKAIHAIYEGGKYFSGDISPILVRKFLENIQSPKNQTIEAPTQAPKTTTLPPIKLTKRQKQILELAVTGLSNKEIAERLDKSIRTVEAHRFTLMKKMQVKNLIELSIKGKKYGFIN